MKLPNKPIKWEKVFEESGEELFKLARESDILKKSIEFNKRYLYWDELKYRTSNSNEQKYLWVLMKFSRSQKYEEIYKSLHLKYVSLPEINKLLNKFDKYLAGQIEVQTRTLGLEKRYIISSLMEEAIASSILEGAMTTRKAAKEMLQQRRKPKNKYEQMIINGYETMQMILKRKTEKLTPEFILEIQSHITKETLDDKDIGKYRDNNEVIIGDKYDNDLVYHTPPDFKEVNKLINELCDFANNDDEFIHPIIKGIILHFLIGYIHPFNDGNGRTARSVFYWYVLSRGYWLFEYMALSRRILRSKKDYGLAYLYSEYDELDLTYFIRYNLQCIDDALNDLLEYIKLKQKEQQEIQRITETIRGLNYRQLSILEEMRKNPSKFYTIQEIAQIYSVVYQTARMDLLSLTDKGYIIMKKISKKFVFKINPDNMLF